MLLKINPDELIENKHGVYWDIPGGRVEFGDSIEETLLREVEEECGIKNVKINREIGFGISNIRIPLKFGGDVGLVLAVYECEIPEDSTIVLSNENIEYDYFSPAEAAKLLGVKFPLSIIKKIEAL